MSKIQNKKPTASTASSAPYEYDDGNYGSPKPAQVSFFQRIKNFFQSLYSIVIGFFNRITNAFLGLFRKTTPETKPSASDYKPVNLATPTATPVVKNKSTTFFSHQKTDSSTSESSAELKSAISPRI